MKSDNTPYDLYDTLMFVKMKSQKLNLWRVIERDSTRGYRITDVSADTGEITFEHPIEQIKKL